MTNKKLERREFLQFCGVAAISNYLTLNPFQLFANENSKKKNIQFKLSKPRWVIYENGSFDLLAEEIRLLNCRPAIDDQTVMPKNVFLGDSPKGERIVYELPGGFLMLDLKSHNDSISIGAEFSGFSKAPHWFFPISQAEIKGVQKFFKQGFGSGGESGIFYLENSVENNDVKNNPGIWSSDSFLSTALLSENETIAIGNLDQKDFLQRSTIYKHSHRNGLNDQKTDDEKIFFEAAILLENIAIENEYIKLPELHFFAGNKPFETLQELAWRTAEQTNARQGSVTSFHWISAADNENSFEKLKSQVVFLDAIQPKLNLHTLMLNQGYCEIGDWLETNNNWPGGLDRVAREIFKDGYRAGIWIAPFMASENSKLAKQHPDWLAKDYNNNPILKSEKNNNSLYVLDISHPGVQKYLVKVFKTLRKMGFIFYELAHLSAGFLHHKETLRKKDGKTSVQLFREMLTLIRTEVGEGSLIMASEAPFTPLIGFADIMKITRDSSSSSNRVTTFTKNIHESFFTHYFNNVYWQNYPGAINLSEKNNSITKEVHKSIALWNGIIGGAVGFTEELIKLTTENLNTIRFSEPSKRQKNAYFPFWPNKNELKIAVRVYKKHRAWGVLFVNDSEIPVRKSYFITDLIEEEKAFIFDWKFDSKIFLGELNELEIELQPFQSSLLYFSEKNEAPPNNLTLGGLISGVK